MTANERMLARILFILRLLKANNSAFQQLFWTVMTACHKQDFVPIRPQGAIGDGGNDGYLPAEGHYFQVYGPVDPTDKVTTASGKLVTDFNKLKVSWEQSTPLQAYSFVFNDKYEGTFTEIALALAKIEKANPHVRCRPFTAAQLEDQFLQLPDDQICRVLDMNLPDPSTILKVDYGVLKEVIDQIVGSPAKQITTRFGDFPDLAEKITLNNLCSLWSDQIRSGSRHSGHIDRYFSKNSAFAKQALRDHLVTIYEIVRNNGRTLAALPVGISREDLIFQEFRSQLLPENATHASECAVDCIIGYYFEACDIFDPLASKDSPNASA